MATKKVSAKHTNGKMKIKTKETERQSSVKIVTITNKVSYTFNLKTKAN